MSEEELRKIAESFHDQYGQNVRTEQAVLNLTRLLSKITVERALDRIYPIVYLDCIVTKVQQDKRVINKSIYVALGITSEGTKDVLGLWISENEGSKFWLSVLTELKAWGLQEVCVFCVDGLKGIEGREKNYLYHQCK